MNRLFFFFLLAALLVASARAKADPPATAAADPFKRDDFVMYSPSDHQVFQRQTRKNGMILVSGHANVRCDGALVRISGKSLDGELPDKWVSMPIDRATGIFCAWVPAPAGGWYH